MKEILLTRGMFALVDDEDYERVVARGNWYAHLSPRTAYARKNIYHPGDGSFTALFMHTVITGWPYVDHHNGNGLDNQRVNLREATPATNAMNRRMPVTNMSGFKGVRRQRGAAKWTAQIHLNRQQRYLGTFATPEMAARAYDAAALELFGEFACLNFPKEFAS